MVEIRISHDLSSQSNVYSPCKPPGPLTIRTRLRRIRRRSCTQSSKYRYGDSGNSPHCLIPSASWPRAQPNYRLRTSLVVSDLIFANTCSISTLRDQSSIMIPKIYSLSTLVFLAVLVSLLVGTQGAAKSVVIDNVDTRILYSPDGWATEVTCPTCFPQLDKSQVHGGTWRFSKYAHHSPCLRWRAHVDNLAIRPTRASPSSSLVRPMNHSPDLWARV